MSDYSLDCYCELCMLERGEQAQAEAMSRTIKWLAESVFGKPSITSEGLNEAHDFYVDVIEREGLKQ